MQHVAFDLTQNAPSTQSGKEEEQVNQEENMSHTTS